MNRHSNLNRLSSGVLFSAPADWTTAKTDIPRFEKRKRSRAPRLDYASQYHRPGVQSFHANYAPRPYYENSVFHHFSNAPKTVTHYESLDSQWGTLPPIRADQSDELCLPPIRADQSAELCLPPIRVDQSAELCLPILYVSVDVTIDGVISLTKVTQSFHNPSELSIPEAKHTFPLYDGAVVTSFGCQIGDTRRLQGVVKPKFQAKEEFEKAKTRKREAAALLEELTPDILETSLGNIPAKTKVEITLTYVHELKVVTSQSEKAEGIAITIPTSLAPKYAPPEVSSSFSTIPSERLEISIKILDDGTMNGAAGHVESDHRATYKGYQRVSNTVISSIAELGYRNPTDSNKFPMQHVWHYSSKSQPFLRSDFIMVVTMHKEARLHSRAVITPPNEAGHAAIMVSLRPNDIFGSAICPESFNGEILFILDRSSSMGWPVSGEREFKINTMKRAMLLALAGLPTTCTFNIISFGWEVRGMWAESREYNEVNLSHARAYISTVKPDMGGTRVLLALESALKNRLHTRPSTQIILVTDGEVDDEPHETILNCVWKARQEFGDQVRFFTLGIGDHVSHRIMESISELGGGYCDVVDVVKSQRWEDRFNRMLRSAMEPDNWACEMSLGPGFEERSLAVQDFESSSQHEAHAVYAQGPRQISALDPFRYKSVFFLLHVRTALPTTVTITTTSEAAKRRDYNIGIEPASLQVGTIHHLAAKAILLSLADEVKKEVLNADQARSNGEILGMRYNVSSEWTSFVAVEENNEGKNHKMDVYKSLFVPTELQIFLASELEGNNFDSDGSGSDCGSGQRRRTSPNPSSSTPYMRRTVSEILNGPPWRKPSPPHGSQAQNHQGWIRNRPYAICGDSPMRSGDLGWEPGNTHSQRNDIPPCQSLSNGSISWEDVIECVDNGKFILTDELRARLRLHFCRVTSEKMCDILRNLPTLTQNDKENTAALVDTLMMIQYFKTHLLADEKFWNLIIGKAERSALLAMGYKEDQEAMLETLYDMSLSAICHAHLPEAMKHAAVGKSDANESVGLSSTQACLMCNTLIDAGDGREVTTRKAFVCPSDECFDVQTSSRRRYSSWDKFWEHQVQSGHMLCPEVEGGSEANPSIAS